MRPVHVFSTDIRMEFEMKKCGILTMKREEVVRSEGIKLPESEVMKDCEKEENKTKQRNISKGFN